MTRYRGAHSVCCECPECMAALHQRQQQLTPDAPMNALPDHVVSTRELLDYQVLEDWSDD